MARGRSTDYAGSKNKGRSRSQSKARKLKCYHCHKEGHYRKDCPERKGKKKDNFKTADTGVVEDNSNGADVLSVTISSSDGGWILDTEFRKNEGINGVTEWTNRTFLERARFMLSNARLLKEFWTAAYLVNRSPSATIDYKTPEEVWSGKHANYENLRIYGCLLMLMLMMSLMLSKKKELIDAGKDHGVREKVELEVRALDSLPIIPTDKADGSHSTEENEEP
ncbi:hypothetical protein RJ639_042377 [Escallonia herrerae]|uniref:CCHC-type domain-containing protein n=1 Tax=Escallonia herrerae TaxID=1293975 RepID=A0AA89B1T9_9ASTE|nr:hypothetical protein RJ639_042377 [Escallonia herrerae]